MLRSYLLALQFLTRLPVPALNPVDDEQLQRSLLFYPLVGITIGLLLVLLALQVLPLLHIKGALAAALVLGAWVMITGGLHLDGLADSADAWAGGGGNRDRALSIMKDPRCGAAALVWTVVVLMVKFAALDALITGAQWQGLLLAPVLGRTAVPLVFATTVYVRPAGLGAAYSRQENKSALWWVVGMVCIIVGVLAGTSGLFAMAGAALVFWRLRAMMLKHVGGATGDTVGAVIELTETVVLIAVVISA
jgi:adenosylcobinamide-GDP ribazoletransferase